MSWITYYGYGQAKLAGAGYDPVVLKLEARYHREVFLGETIRDIPEVSRLSHDGTMWKMYYLVTKLKKSSNFEEMRSLVRATYKSSSSGATVCLFFQLSQVPSSFTFATFSPSRMYENLRHKNES
jgi:hypothetical protein